MRSSFKTIASICMSALLIVSAAGGSVSATFGSTYMDSGAIKVNIDTSKGRSPISPYIYGINAESPLAGVTVNAVTQTNPLVSSYNWESNLSNNGANNSDYLVSSYTFRPGEPAMYADNLVARASLYGISSKYVTLQMMGKTAGHSSSDSTWEDVSFSKNDSYLSRPDPDDGVVYMDEYVSYLVNKYGYAVNGGINGYFLDREPENWHILYPDAVPSPVTADDLIERSSELAYSVKKIDPTALVYGPSPNGIEAFISLKNQSDWEKHGLEYSWFIDYYLDGMRKASERAGTRLLDVLDIHYHTEATNGLLEPIVGSNDVFSSNVRLQAPRILWDSSYTENSTTAILYNQHIPLIPTLAASVDMYYPGTGLSFSEYNFGGGGDISGGIAAADALGIFAKYGVHMACAKPDTMDITYIKSAINIYTNYDGAGSGFGNTFVSSENGKDIMSSVYASVDGSDDASLRIILINKNRTANKPADIDIKSAAQFVSAEVYSFNSESPEIVRAEEDIAVEDNRFTLDMEPLTVYMLVLNGGDTIEDYPFTGTGGTGVSSPENTGGTASAVSAESSVTSAVHEHVAAETYSTVSLTGDSFREENTDTLSGDASGADTVQTTADGLFSAETSGGSIPDGKSEKTVPKGIKTAVSILVAAVFVAMGYILVSDYIVSRRKK